MFFSSENLIWLTALFIYFNSYHDNILNFGLIFNHFSIHLMSLIFDLNKLAHTRISETSVVCVPSSSLMSVRQLVRIRLRLAADRAAVTAAYRQPRSCLRTMTPCVRPPRCRFPGQERNRGRGSGITATTLPSCTYKTHTRGPPPTPTLRRL